MIEGVELTARDLEAVLGRHGVKKLDPKGQKFDPNFHQAIFEAPDETVPSGTVAQVVQTGWTIGDRVLRPAMVGISKGGPKAAPKEQPGERQIAAKRPAPYPPCHPPQRQIYPGRPPPAAPRSPRIRSTPWKARRPSPRSATGVAGGEAEGAGRRVAFESANAKERRVAKRKRDDRDGRSPPRPRCLMQAHPRRSLRRASIRQALGRGRRGRAFSPQAAIRLGAIVGDGRPVSVGRGQCSRVRRDRAERTAIALTERKTASPVRAMRGRNGGASARIARISSRAPPGREASRNRGKWIDPLARS